MEDCIFCKIVGNEAPSDMVYQDNLACAFRDINPKAPTHILIIPKKHVRSMVEAKEDDKELLGHLLYVTNQVAKKEGVSEDGFRVVINSGSRAGQTVWHLHIHLIGGRKMSWPPG